MQKNTLDTLYDMFQPKLDYRLDNQEIKRTRDALMKMTNDPQAEYAAIDHAIANERAGFRNGFKIATQILSECLTTGCITDDIPEDPFGA